MSSLASTASLKPTHAETITTVTTECVLPVEPTSEHVSQCCNRAGNISGERTGVAITDLESRVDPSLITF